jgi:hypothetical protein
MKNGGGRWGGIFGAADFGVALVNATSGQIIEEH